MQSLFQNLNRLQAAPRYAAAAALAIALVWGLAIFKIAEDKKLALESVRNDLHNVVIGLKEHSQDSFNAADEALRLLKFHYEDKGTRDLDLVNRYFHQNAVDIGALNQVGIIDANGIYIYSSLPNHNRIDLSDREHFKVHKQIQPYPLFVSKPVIGRATGKWSFQMTRRINDKNGQFKGVAVASLKPDRFLDRYSRIQLGPDSLIGLVGLDGYARTMRVGDHIRADDNLRNLVLPKNMEEATSGHFFSNDFFDQTRRLFVFERLSGLPLLAIVGVREDVALQHFQRQKNIVITVAWVLSLLIVLAAWHALHTVLVQTRLRAELSDRQELLQRLEEEQREGAARLAQLQRSAAFGQVAQDRAMHCQAAVDALQTSMAGLEKQRNLYENLTQLYFRLKLKQISAEEFTILIRKFQPEQALEDLNHQLNAAKAQLQQLGSELAALARQRP